MRRRPQPNPRRGVLRAVAVAILLIIVLIVGLLVTSAVTAPPAQAPTVPPTPPPLRGTGTPLRVPTVTRRASPVPTRKKGALGVAGHPAGVELHQKAADSLYGQVVRQRVAPRDAAVSRDGRSLAYFLSQANAYAHNPLFIKRPAGPARQIGFGDPFVRPVWSPDGLSLLYVRVAEDGGFPGARWSLVLLDTRSGREQILAAVNAMNLTPLGWSGSQPMYLVATSTDTIIFSISRGKPREVGIMLPQPLTTATLSPDGRFIAFASPSNCSYCTLNVYDLAQKDLSIGSSGLPNESVLAWTTDSSRLVAIIKGRLDVVDPRSLDTTRSTSLPASLPAVWGDPLRVRVLAGSIHLTDPVTGRRFTAGG